LLEPTPLEMHESIELIRALEYGIKVRMIPVYTKTKSVFIFWILNINILALIMPLQ
jgi:hypothetical protein